MNISDQLTDYTVSISNFDEKRDYVSLSHISKTVDELVNDYKNGFTTDLKGRLKCYKGYQMEKDLVNRLNHVFKDRVGPAVEIVGPDPLIKGHTDFTLDGFPGDCKSVLKDDHFPEGGRLPNKVFWQVQGYMLYMKKEKALVIYESRESGIIKSYWVYENKNIQEMIDKKCRIVVSMIK